jgi:hypothetical protein
MLTGTALENTGVRVLVKHLGRITAFVERTVQGIKIMIPSVSKLAKQLINSLAEPEYEQLTFQFTPV